MKLQARTADDKGNLVVTLANLNLAGLLEPALVSLAGSWIALP